jgi:membrane protease YdiL (CAAX protease family)
VEALAVFGVWAMARTVQAMVMATANINPRFLTPQGALLTLLLSLLVYAAMLGASVIFSIRRFHGDLDDLGFRALPRGRIYAPIVGMGLALFVTFLYRSFTVHLRISQLVPRSDPLLLNIRYSPGLLLLAFVLTCVVAPLVEEIYFRGVLFQGMLGKKLPRSVGWLGATSGFWVSAAVSAAIFGIYHQLLATLIPLTLAGLILAWVYWQSRSLWGSISVHAVNNALALAFLLHAR